MITSSLPAQNFIMPLWPDGVPNSTTSDEKEIHAREEILRISKVQDPGIAVYLPSKRSATGQAVVICPGGGYRVLAYDWEGVDIARWFNSKGIAAIVLKYRLPDSKSILVRHEAPLQDAQRAVRMVRHNAGSWNIDSNRIGVMGFSAGGHLASTIGTIYDHHTIDAVDSIDLVSARPDFLILVYPVISFRDSFTHSGSRNSLLGENPDPELIRFYSNELNVNPETPPSFLIHSGDDRSVPVENSIYFYQALKDNGVRAEMHIYPEGGHGFSLALGRGHLQGWTDRLYDWLRQEHIQK